MSRQSLREETERLVREALERKSVEIKHGNTRIEAKCGNRGAPNRLSAPKDLVRVKFTCKECGQAEHSL